MECLLVHHWTDLGLSVLYGHGGTRGQGLMLKDNNAQVQAH